MYVFQRGVSPVGAKLRCNSYSASGRTSRSHHQVAPKACAANSTENSDRYLIGDRDCEELASAGYVRFLLSFQLLLLGDALLPLSLGRVFFRDTRPRSGKFRARPPYLL